MKVFFFTYCVPFLFLSAQGWIVMQLLELNQLKSDLKSKRNQD